MESLKPLLASGVPNRLVMSVPAPFHQPLWDRVPEMLGSYETFSALFRRARRMAKVFSPYVDPAFTALLGATRCPVRVVSTTDSRRRGLGNGVLERCASFRNLSVRYMVDRRAGTQIFQVHAKMILVDGQEAYVGSANLTDTSLHYNLELGILTQERRIVSSLEKVFDFLFENVAVPASRL